MRAVFCIFTLTTACILIAASCRQETPARWLEPSTEPYDPTRMGTAAGRMAEWLAVNNPTAALALQPGLDAAAVTARSQTEGCALPEEVTALLRWHNGMRAATDVPLIWYHRVLSLEDSFERRRTYRNPVLRATLPLPDDWFPIFEFQGEFYFTRCQSEQPQASIWHWSGEDPELRPVFGSLAALLETALAWYERGAVWVADPNTGMLDSNLAQVFGIYSELNPGYTFPYHVPEVERPAR